MGTKRANGEGTRPRRRKDNRWEVKISIPRPDGGTQRITIYAKTSREAADAARRERIKHVDAGGYKKPERKTLAVFLEQWLRDVAKPSVRPSTYRSYEGIVRNHLTPALGHIQLMKLTPPLVARALSGDEDAGAARTRQLAYIVLRSALDVAVKWDLAHVNVASAVEKPRVARAEFSVLTPDQVNTLLAKIRDDRLFTLYLLAIFTGLRQGELLALTWADVSLDDCRLEVRYTLEPTSLERVEVKTRRGRRRVDLSPTLVTELRTHRQRMLAEGHPHSLVFPTKGGHPIKGSTLGHEWKRVLARAFDQHAKVTITTAKGNKYTPVRPLVDIRFHDLRHTAATLMLLAGVHPKVVSERLGHATVAMTLDTYSHVLPSLQSDTTLAIERYLAVG